MTIFALALYSCVTMNDLSGSLMSKTCGWHSAGTLFETEASCEAAGAGQVGKPYYTDVADGAVFENYRCYPQGVSK